ncbi:atlastin-2-like isoform X2 [Chironomus tepperi]
MWNDIFLHTIEESGDEIAIVVMDTQGLFDNETLSKNNSKIFALSTLVSSIQVLNLSGVIQEDQLQYLQFATEFAKFAADDSHGASGKPFQELLFLVRDWANPDEYPFGTDGGDSYLEDFLKIKDGQKEELKSVRQFIHNSFDKLSCALFPHPGKAVSAGGTKIDSQTKKYDGNWGEMDEDFKIELFNLIEHLLKPDRLVLKKINGKDLKGSEFLEYVLQYFKLFQSDKLPQAQSIYESTVEKQMNILVDFCVETYKGTVYMNQDVIRTSRQITIFHDVSRNKALQIYKKSKKMGNSESDENFKLILEVKIGEAFKEWKESVENRIQIIEAEKERVRLELDEQHQLEVKRRENERRIQDEIYRQERLKTEEELRRLRAERLHAAEEFKRLRTDGIWVDWSTSKSGVPEFAVLGGSDKNGSYYVIRAKRENEMIVGKYCPQLKKAYIPYGGREVEVTSFEILTHTRYIWRNKSNQTNRRIPGGYDILGNTIYIIQAFHDGNLIPGKLHHNEAYVSNAGYEYKKAQWSVLEVVNVG